MTCLINTVNTLTKAVALAASLLLAGCMALQSATFSTPTIDTKKISHFSYGDGIAFKLPEICIAVREGVFSADYRNNFAGPLIFTIFPLEIFEPEHKADFYEITLDLVPYQGTGSVALEPRKVELHLKSGTVLYPYAYRLWHHYSQPEPIKTIDQVTEPIVLRETNTNISLRYKKENEADQMSKLFFGGLNQKNKQVEVPTITFGSRTTHYRYIYSGRTKDNLPMSSPIVQKCHQ